MDNIKKVFVIGNNETIKFASNELVRYLNKMTAGIMTFEAESKNEINKSINECIWLGLFRDLSVYSIEPPLDASMDDEIYIDIENSRGMIAGINPRSVLLSVYRYLYELGCRWIRPGFDGESIPERIMPDVSIKIKERPSYRHRGICIEGAVSLENVISIIDLLPKLGMNSYFIQFREAFTFFERWYHHSNNPLKEAEPFSIEKARKFVKIIEKEVKKRGLIYHAVGHGWTCEPLGIPGLSWDKVEGDYPLPVTQYFAQINGERKMLDGIPLNLNLCYSKPEVRRMMVNCIADYLKVNRNIDILHFWLADGINNQCECENCIKETPTDFYVQMLNELDTTLTDIGINTKIVFLLYFDLLWAPEKNHIKNEDRFIMMFAPITRTYTYPFKGENIEDPVIAYKRNDIYIPNSIDENIAFLNKWKREFSGDSFDFDYHFMWDHFYDQGSLNISKIVHEDIRNLEKIGLDGLISCQCQRVFLPSGLGIYTMAKTLWKKDAEFDAIAEDYFKSAFGENGDACYQYLLKLSELFDPPYIRGEKGMEDRGVSHSYRLIEEVCKEFGKLIDENKGIENPCHNKSWHYLSFHKEICIRLSQMLKERALNNMDAVKEKWEELKEYIQTIEDEIQPVFDLYEFVQTFEVMNKYILKEQS